MRKRCKSKPLQCKLTHNDWVNGIPPVHQNAHQTSIIKRRSKVFSKTSQCSRTTVWKESIQNSNAVALRVVVGFNLPDEITRFVDIVRISCLERWLWRWYNFLTSNKVMDVHLISFQFSNIVHSKCFAINHRGNEPTPFTVKISFESPSCLRSTMVVMATIRQNK